MVFNSSQTVLVMTVIWPRSLKHLKLAKRCVVSDHLHCSFSNVHGSQGPWVVLEKASTLLKSPWKLKKIAQVLEKSLNFPQWPLNRIEGFLNNWNFSNATLSCTQGTLKAQRKTVSCVKHRVKLFQVRVVTSGVDHCCYLTYLRTHAFQG